MACVPLDLNEGSIGRLLDGYALGQVASVTVLECVDSTNSCLLRQARHGDIHGKVLLAREQSQGRGRRGRVWHSPPGAGLYLSVGWRLSCPAETRPLFSLMISVAVLRTLDELLPCPVQLKWPNDVLADGRKLAGILLECSREAGGEQWIIGIGLNTRLPAGVDSSCIDLATLMPKPPSGNVLAARLIVHVFSLLREFAWQAMPPKWLAEWRSHDACLGRNAELLFVNQRIGGRVEGVDDTGRLLLRTGPRLGRFAAGSLRLLAAC